MSDQPEQPPQPPQSPPPPPGGSQPPPPPGAGYGAPPPGGGYEAPAPSGMPTAFPAGMPSTSAGYAEWPQRALAGLVDYFGPFLVAFLVGRGSSGLGLILQLAALGWALYNAYLGGQTGQSYGKKIAGIRLISEATGAPPGGGLGIGRYVVHILDALPCYIGFLWPIWDSKKQTFADKLLKTVVVKA